MQPSNTSTAVKVGLVVLAALVVFAFGVFLIGEQSNLFRSKNRYGVRLESVSGLESGNPVQLNGVDVGRVEEVRLPKDPDEHLLEVTITVDARYQERIRADSRARIKTLGLLGDKFVDLTSGSPEEPIIENGGEIPAAEATDVDRLLASGEDVVENIVSISVSLKEILARMERGEGLLGELMSPRQAGEPGLTDTLTAVNDMVAGVSSGLEDGQGPLGRLLHDKAMGDRLAASVTRLAALLEALESGDGPVPALLHDGEMRARLEQTLSNLESASGRLDNVATRFDEGDGLLPKLIDDEAFAQEITEELKSLLERLNAATAKLTEGDGTVAKLLDDPSIYEALNDVVVGINESKFLRWLIRNRQKKGIKKRYEEEKAAAEAAGEVVTPPE